VTVIAGQQQLYRAKASVDLCVVAALATVAIAPCHPATRYVDLLGSLYLVWSGVRLPAVEWIPDNGAKSMVANNHFGLAGMKERVEAFHGTFQIFSKPNDGTKIEVKIPIGNR
jgi:hypothetical protein